MSLALAIAAGALIGLSLGALGGGGSILAVPVLVYALGQSPAQATTGSLVVVGATSLVGAVAAYRTGHVQLTQGATFGVIALGGAVIGAKGSALVSEPLLLVCFAALMLLVAALMTLRLIRGNARAPQSSAQNTPTITFRPTFTCRCTQALKLLVSATVVGLLTGFLGVGGGFLVVPALLLVLALPMEHAAGTSLVVITMTSAVALAVRAGTGVAPDWSLVLILMAASVAGAVAGGRLASRTDTHRLQIIFTVLVLAVAVYTAAHAVPALF